MKLYPKLLPQGINDYKRLMADRQVSFGDWKRYADAIRVYNDWEKDVRIEEIREQYNATRVFLGNIRLLLNNADTILADSRMSLALLPDAGGLAYVGAAFYKPTLATYLEWWRTCEDSHLIIDGREYWLYYLSGSPLSGANKCKAVSADGDIRCVDIRHFMNAWRSFLDINRKYRGLPRYNEHFTIKEVVDRLTLKPLNPYDRKKQLHP